MLLEVYKCVQLNICSVVCGCFSEGAEGRRVVSFVDWVGMKFGWDFYWF